MKEFQKQPKKRSILHSPLALLVFAFFLIVFLFNTAGLIRKNHETAQNKARAVAENEKLLKQKEEISKDIDNLSDPKYTEEIIREKFGAVKEGEGVVIVVDDTTNAETAVAASAQGGFWNFFKNLFHKK